MFNLTIYFGPNNVAWPFLFKTEESGKKIYNTYVENSTGGMLLGADDYGQAFAIPFDEIRGMLFEDMEAGQEARIVLSINQAKTQARAQKRAQTDPEMRQLMQEQQRGPAVISPGGFNGGLRQ